MFSAVKNQALLFLAMPSAGTHLSSFLQAIIGAVHWDCSTMMITIKINS